MPRTLVLDLDGTLVDTLPDIAAALNRLLARRRLAPFAGAEVAALVGDGSRRLVERAFVLRGENADGAAVDAFLADYAAHVAVESRPFPGVFPTLRRLRDAGWQLALCTNKSEAATRRILDALDLAGFFAAVGAGDSFSTRKPDPGPVTATIAAAGGAPERSVMAGDHANDVAAARGAGLPCIFAAWGYGTPAMAAGAAAVAQSFPDLAGIVLRLRPL